MSKVLKVDEKNEFKKFSDINSIEDIDFAKMELIRGETPADIKEKCLRVCKDYLSGNWCQQTTDTITVRRITGGMINQLYYCAINELDRNNSGVVAQEVAIKWYGQNIYKDFEKSRTRDVVNALIFSENKLGPKIYALFEEGQIQKYYTHRYIQCL